MKYDEFKTTCQKAWSERFNYLCIDMAKIKNEGKNHIFNGSKTTYFESIPEREPFYKITDVSKNKYRRFTKLNKLDSLESQVKAVRLKEMLG